MAFEFHFADLFGYGGLILQGIGLTILLTLAAIASGLTLGVLGALGRRSRRASVRFMVGAYVELIRNTPFIVQLFFVFFALCYPIALAATALERRLARGTR